jgi:excisionase family DNA binding protein
MKAKPTRPVAPVALSIDETIRATGLGRSTIYQEMAAGRLKSFKIGRRRFVSPEALTQWRAAHENAAA